MANHWCLPDKRLIGEITSYAIAYEAHSGGPYHPTSAIAFNTDGVSIALDGEVFTGDCLFCIADDRNMRVLEKGQGELVLVGIRMGGFYRLFDMDGRDYPSTVIEAGHNSHPQFNAVADALKAAPKTVAGRVEALDQVFLDRLEDAHPYGIGEKFRFMAQYTKGSISVEDAAERFGISVRSLERECRMRFDRTPKRILRGYRLAATMFTRTLREEAPKWSNLEDAELYSDQAHFLRDARKLAGMTPGQYHEILRQTPRNLVHHARDDVSISGERNDPRIAPDWDESFRWFPYGEETVKELGLEDWDTT